MIFRSIFNIIFIGLVISLSSSLSAQKASQLPIIQQEITIDGKSNDWPDYLLQIPKSPYIYFTGQRGNDLIIGIEISDFQLKEQILLTGLTIWINEKGKKKEDLGITYPLGLPEDQRPNDPELLWERRKQLAEDTETSLAGFTSMELVNFYGNNEKTWGSNKNPDGIQVDISFDEKNRLIYEAKIPMDVIFKDIEKLKSSRKSGFTIGIYSGTLPRPSIQGDMGVGVNGGSLSNPTRTEGNWARSMHQMLETYRLFTVEKKAWTQKYYLSGE